MTRRERDRRLIAEAGPWCMSPRIGSVDCDWTLCEEAGEASEAAARELNRIAREERKGRKK